MKALVEALCSDECAGRTPGSAGGRRARRHVIDALRDAGLDPLEHEVPGCRGANVIAALPGDIDRWVMVAAHYDHLGTIDGEIYRGADDNAAAVAILVEVARGLAAERADGRGVIIAAFDAEEPPYFMSAAMGSEHYARHPTVALESIDLMFCMDLVGHALGPEGLPRGVRDSVFVLGAERSPGTRELLQGIDEEGVVARVADAALVPPLSDYAAFWERRRPFVFLTNGRSRIYHTPRDLPSELAWSKMGATARWLERAVRATCARDEAPFAFVDQTDDLSTLDSMIALLSEIAAASPQAQMGLRMATVLRGAVRVDRSLPTPRQAELAMLVAGIESSLA